MEFTLFPYEKVRFGSRVVIYGMGEVGYSFVQQLFANHFCHIVAVVDRNYKNIDSSLVKVESPEILCSTSYDAVVIAIKSKRVIEQILNYLNTLGINSSKIIYQNHILLMARPEFQTKYYGRLDDMFQMLYGIESYCQNEFLQKGKFPIDNFSAWKKYNRIHTLLQYKKITGPYSLIRMGRKEDGGYLLLSDLQDKKIMYSFGVGGDISFEVDMAAAGLKIFLYDHTVAGIPIEHANIKFVKKGLIGKHDDQCPYLMTIPEILQQNHHENEKNIVLKMDIEGAEWDFLKFLTEEDALRFSQIVFELHGFTDLNLLDDILFALEKLNKTHQLIHVHANNYSRIMYYGNMLISDALEVTYVRRKDYRFQEAEVIALTDQDRPCNPSRPERFL